MQRGHYWRKLLLLALLQITNGNSGPPSGLLERCLWRSGCWRITRLVFNRPWFPRIFRPFCWGRPPSSAEDTESAAPMLRRDVEEWSVAPGKGLHAKIATLCNPTKLESPWSEGQWTSQAHFPPQQLGCAKRRISLQASWTVATGWLRLRLCVWLWGRWGHSTVGSCFAGSKTSRGTLGTNLTDLGGLELYEGAVLQRFATVASGDLV